MIVLAAAAALGASTACTGGLCNAATLQPFLAKLAQAGPGKGGRPIHILQIGDSHTAGDAITGACRDLLQTRLGSGGRGVLAPGRPYNGYLTHGITVTMSPGWKVAADFGRDWSSPSPPLGLSAYTLTSEQDGATMNLVADPNEMFDRIVLCGIARPGGGSVALRAGTQNVTFDLGSPSERPECRTVKLPVPTSSADLTTMNGPVTLTSWATFRDAGGVTLSNLGVVGSQLIHFARTDDTVLSEELRAYQPDLIVLAFGTNEGFAPRFSPFEYEIVLRTQIGRLRRLAGNVPILLLGAPDALTRREELRANSSVSPSTNCAPLGAPVIAAPPPPPLPSSVIAGIMDRLRASLGMSDQDGAAAASGTAPATATPAPTVAATPPAPARGALFPPAALRSVRDVQRRGAQSLNVAYWDWEARMGGRCTADDWVHRATPLMRGDYVHYTSAGGREVAQRLQADLDRVTPR